MKILHRTLAISILMLIVSSVPSAIADISIVVNLGSFRSATEAGNSEAAVDWLDDDARDDVICTENYAALELQKYLRKMTGRADDFVIHDDDRTPDGELILVGSTDSNAAARRLAEKLGVTLDEIKKLGPEDYRLKTAAVDGRRITLIAGGGRAGTLYGVYDMLQRMGCRWFSPAEFDEDVPHVQWNPAFDAVERPAFEIRGFRMPAKRGGPPMFHWIARHRLNLWCLDREHEPLLRKLCISNLSCGGHYIQERFLNPLSDYRYDHSHFTGDDEQPADPWPVSESFRGDVDGDGKLSTFEAHPEWFPLIDGQRICNNVRLFGSANFCTSNQDAVAELMNRLVEEFSQGDYRGANLFEAWSIDGGRWCQCSECKALGSPTDRLMLLAHRFDQEIKRARRKGQIHRPVNILFLVYRDVLAAPTKPLPKDFDYQTCTAQMFLNQHCYVHPVGEKSCPRNAVYQRRLRDWLSDPGRHYRGRLCVGEYYDYGRYENLPVCYMRVMAADIPYFHRLGVRRFHYMHVPTGRWGSKSLTNCQMARQVWDVATDCEAFWTDYFRRRYESAAPIMRRYYESLEKMLCNIQLLKGWSPSICTRLNRAQKPLFPDPHMRYRREVGIKCTGPTFVEMLEHGRQCRKLIDEARTMQLPERIRNRLAEDEQLFSYAELTLRYYYACVQAYESAWAGKTDEARRHYEAARQAAQLLSRHEWSISPEQTFHFYHPLEKNAFTATNATKALDHIAKLIDADAPPLP